MPRPWSGGGETNRLLVVAPRAWLPALQESVTFKRTLLPVEVRPLEDVLQEATGTDDAEKLKWFLYAEWRKRGLGYVLLVGDVDGREHVGTDTGEKFRSPPPPPAPYQQGRFHPTGLGEQMLKRNPNGAVAYIGCNTGSQPCALTLADGFVRALAEARKPRLGDCWAAAVRFYFEAEHLASLKPNDDWYPPSIFFQGMKFMLFGDPSLRLPASRP